PLHAVTVAQATEWVLCRVHEARATEQPPRLVVTLNPEIVVQASVDPRLAEALRAADLSVADGVGVAWAARRAGMALPGRVPGVDLAFEVMRQGGSTLRVFFLGAKPGVAERAAAEARRRFGIVVAGAHHGYFDKAAPGEALRALAAADADLLLAGLGEGQELF